jgi:rhodanese-related sulfurtransferase
VTKKAPRQPENTFAPHPDKAYIEIHGDDVVGLHKKGVLFLDARRTSVYEQGHIAGARPFSVWEGDIDEKVNKLFAERSDPRDQNLPIVIYCSGGDCEDSHMLAQKLWGIQFNNVYVYKDGFPDWQKRGGPIHTGSTP